MASRRFFAYDPYDYYYNTPYHYPYPYYHNPASARNGGAFFPAAGNPDNAFFPAVESPEPAVRNGGTLFRAAGNPDNAFFPDVKSPEPAVRGVVHPKPRSRSVSVPVHFVGSDPEPEPELETAVLHVPPVARMAASAKRRAPSVEEAAVRVQAAVRGFQARRMVREVRAVELEAEGFATKVAHEAEALRGDARARVAVGEALMRLLLRLDAVRGAREYRRKVTKRVLALQDAVDALEPRQAVAPVTVTPVATDDALADETVEMAEAHAEEESEMALEMPQAAEHGVEIGAKSEAQPPVIETAAEMEVVGGRPIGDEAEPDKTELVGDGDVGEKAEAEEGEWEMLTKEAAADCNAVAKVPQQEPAGGEKKETGDVAADGLDARKVMEMVAALCERSAQQCAVIGALAERVDTLERAVRRVEETDRRRRRNKKLKKDGKGNSKSARSCYNDQ